MTEPSNEEVTIPLHVFVALYDIYLADREGNAEPESYEVLRQWEGGTTTMTVEDYMQRIEEKLELE